MPKRSSMNVPAQEGASLEIERLLAVSLAGPSSEMTDADWRGLRRLARQADAAARTRSAMKRFEN